MRRALLAAAVVLVLSVVLGLPSSAAASVCPNPSPSWTGPCGPTFVSPPWGDAGGWQNESQYSTIQLADVLGNGRDQLIGRGAEGIEIYEFDTTIGEWRPEVDGQGAPVVLSAFADPPPLTSANPSFTGTDWTLPQYYSTIHTGDVLGNGRDQIIARSKNGVIIFSYTPGANGAAGTWAQVNTSGPFADGSSPVPAAEYSTIQVVNLTGGNQADVIGWVPSQGIQVYRWNGAGWDHLPSMPSEAVSSLDPSVYTTFQLGSADGAPGEIWARHTNGFTGFRFAGGRWSMVDQHLGSGNRLFMDSSFGVQFQTKWESSPSYYATIKFANITGGTGQELLARTSVGEIAFQLTANGWVRIGDPIRDLSDTNGWTQDKYWRSIQFADVDGSGREELLARGPQGVVVYKYDTGSGQWQQLPAATPLQLSDDPWGTDPSYYTTIQAGDVDGSGRDAVIARGPYGIRTWFYDRAGVNGWSSYLPSGYPDFPTAGEKAAFDALNQQARSKLLINSAQTIRSLWTGADEPTAGDMQTLLGQLATLGNCTGNPVTLAPPSYANCAPPSGSIGFTADDWKAVVNEMLAETFNAQEVADYFTQLDGIRQKLFIAEGNELPSIATTLGLGAAENTSTDYDFKGLFSDITSVAGSVIGLTNPEVGAVLAFAAEYLSALPSGTTALTSSITTTYSQLQNTFATGISQMDKQQEVQSQEIRGDLGLLELVGQMRQQGPLKLDATGLVSAGNEGFVQWVYQTLLPTMWDRYVITNCHTNYVTNTLCSPPPAGPWLVGTDLTKSFVAIGPSLATNNPCHTSGGNGVPPTDNCDFSAPDGTLAGIVWGPLSPACAYVAGKSTTAWTFGCNLGINPATSVPLGASPEETWNFPVRNGNPDPGPIGATLGLAGGATGVGASTANVQLKGTVQVPGQLNLSRATVTLKRVLYDAGGGGQLVTALGAGKTGTLTGRSNPPLGALTLKNAGGGNFQNPRGGTLGGGPAPHVALHLARNTTGRLSFNLTVGNVAIPEPPAACALINRRVLLPPSQVPLTLQLQVLGAAKQPLTVALSQDFVCRRDRLGTVDALAIAPTPRAPKLQPALSLAAGGPRAARLGHHVTYTATVRNRTGKTAYDVTIRDVFGPSLKLIGHSPGVRVGGGELVWLVGTLRAGHARTIRVTATLAAITGRRVCDSVSGDATLRHPAVATACTTIKPRKPRAM